MIHSAVVLSIMTCVIVYAILTIILRLWRNQHLYKLAARFPGPPTLPILGNTHLFAGDSSKILTKASELNKLYPSPFRLWFGPYLLIHIHTPEHLKAVLLSPKTIDKGPFYEFAKPWLGTGLLTATGAKWRVHRKLMQPAFGPIILQSFIGTIVARSEIMAKEIGENLDGPDFDISNYISQFALHNICETAMGVSIEGQTDGDFSYANAINKVTDGFFKRLFNPLLYPNFIFNRSEIGRSQKKYIERLHTFTDNVIQMKKKKFSESASYADSEEDNSDSFSRKKALLDHLMEVSDNSGKLSDEALREEVDTIVAVGSDTTAVTTSYVMLMLAFYPEIQEKVWQELCEIYKDKDSEDLHFTPKDLERMTYLGRVIKETMRLFPIAPLISRSVSEDLDIGEHILPKGSIVVLSLIDLHRNEKYWPDPLKFDPDRFLPAEVEKRDSYTYLPFSGGPRSCIGIKYAMMSMKILSATVLRKYVLKKDTVVPIEDLRFKLEVVLRPVHPITLRIEKRQTRI